MRSLAALFACLAALTIFSGRADAATAYRIEATGAPPGFAELDGPRELLLDVYFQGAKIAETRAVTRPGSLSFRSPDEILARLPRLVPTPELKAALSAALPTHSDLACGRSNAKSCGELEPELAGIIYDEEHFRVDLFVNPKFLRTLHAGGEGYLPVPSAGPSLTSALGLAAAGTFGGRSTYNVQNRTLLAFRNARIRTSNSLASGLGWVLDDLAAEVDERQWRYSAGLFWAPGGDLIGQRRLIGAGVATQLDTAVDRETLAGTPLLLFLPRPAQVEILIDGRLVSSRSYPAGNNELDSSALADGSYPVLLRIREENGATREEQRFFVKNAQIAPLGHPLYFAYAGLLADTRPHRPVATSKDFYFQAGAAWRLDNRFAVDLSAFGTQHKLIVEAGSWLLNRSARLRVAALASSAGDAGLLVQLASGAQRPLSFNFDLRRIWSSDGKPLIPLPSFVETFDTIAPVGVQRASGSYVQAIGSVGVHLGPGYLSLLGTYRKDRDFKADYSIGPNLNWPLITRGGVQAIFEASAQRTRTSTAGFAGIRMLVARGPAAVTGISGYSVEKDRRDQGGSAARPTGSLSAQVSHETEGGTLFGGELAADRDLHSSTLRAGGTMFSRLGNARIDLIHGVEGGGGTRYDLSYQSGLALSPRSASFGARQSDQSAIVVAIRGDAEGARFKVLLDGNPRGELGTGGQLSLFVPAYRRYQVRLVSADAAAVEFDPAARDVTLYPGNVASLDWDAEAYFTLVARAVSAMGAPIADALVQSAKAVAQTDSDGYFQIDMRRNERIRIARDGAPDCLLQLPRLTVRNDFAFVGKVTCQ